MNLIDGYVIKVLNQTKRVNPFNGKTYTMFEVEYEDMGGTHTTILSYELGKEPVIEKGFRFLH